MIFPLASPEKRGTRAQQDSILFDSGIGNYTVTVE